MTHNRLLIKEKIDILILVWFLKFFNKSEMKEFMEELLFSTTVNFVLDMNKLKAYKRFIKHEKFNGSILFDENFPMIKD